jgi:WD40 repeat protein
VTLVRLPTGAVLGQLTVRGPLVTALAFDPAGRWLAVADKGGGVQVFDAAAMRSVLALHGHSAAVLGLAFSLDGRLLASAGQDRVVHLWQLPGGRRVARLPGATDTLYAVAISRRRVLAAAGADRVLRLWRLGSASEFPHGAFAPPASDETGAPWS